MLSLTLPDKTLAGIAAFYLICSIPKDSLLSAFREMKRVLKIGGLLLISFHCGDETIHERERWGKVIEMDSFLYLPSIIRKYLEEAGFLIEDIVEREPYRGVEYPSKRAYIFARNA